MIEFGFQRGASAATVFWHPGFDVSLVVHGDDFTALGPKVKLREFEDLMKEWYVIKTRGILGPEPQDDKEITILNRKLRWSEGKITYEADPRIVENILRAMGLESGSKGLDTPLVADTVAEVAAEDVELNAAEATRFRSIAALANYLALDRPDLQVAVSILCQKMSKPTQASWAKLKRVARYLKQHPVLQYEFVESSGSGDGSRGGGGALRLDVYADSDWAGCRESRKSRSGGIALLDGGPVKSWSNRQSSPALSSGEAEFYAAVKAAAEALGLQSLAADLGWAADVVLHVDSTAAKAIASRAGLGRVRHLEVRFLWLQDAVAKRRIAIRKVRGKSNPADLLTKPLPHPVVAELLRQCGVHFEPRPLSKGSGRGEV